MVAISHDLVQNLKQRSRLGASRIHSGFDVATTTIDSDVGWKDSGASNPGSTAFDFPKDLYRSETGSPSTSKYIDIVKWSGKITTEMYEYSSLVFAESQGTLVTVAYVAATTVAYAGTVATSGSSVDYLLGSSLISLNVANSIAASLFIGDTVAVMLGTTGINGGLWQESSRVVDRSTVNNTITLEGTLSNVPPPGASVVKVIYEDIIVGTNDLATKKLRVVTSARNGDMFVLFCNKGAMTAAPAPKLGDGKTAVMMPIEFEAIGQATQLAGYDQPQVTIAHHRIIRVVRSS